MPNSYEKPHQYWAYCPKQMHHFSRTLSLAVHPAVKINWNVVGRVVAFYSNST